MQCRFFGVPAGGKHSTCKLVRQVNFFILFFFQELRMNEKFFFLSVTDRTLFSQSMVILCFGKQVMFCESIKPLLLLSFAR